MNKDKDIDGFSNLIELLLVAPDSQLDPLLRPLIESWDRPMPKAIQVLEVLDKCIFGSLCSDFVVGILDVIYKIALEHENISDSDVKDASWRKGMAN